MMSGRCLNHVWTVFGICLEDAVRVFSGQLDSVWKVFGMSLE